MLEKTLVILKPCTLQRGLVGEITHRFERKGLRLAGMKMMQLTDELLSEHYAHLSSKLEGAECIDAPVVRDGNIITGMGPGAAMEFALTIVDLLVGKEKVDELVEAMCVKR